MSYKYNNKEKMKIYYKQWCKDNPEYRNQYDIKHRYNLSHEDWLKIWKKQDAKCIICEKSFTNLFDTCVDHDHKTGKIRGLLCRKCNRAIGLFNDDPKLMIKIAEYLMQ